MTTVSFAFRDLPYDVRIFQALAIKVALRAYAKHKMQINRAYTPKNMLMAAGRITGAMYKRGEYEKAANDLEKLCDKMKADEATARTVARIIQEVRQ